MARRFATKRQRLELFLYQQGLCALCGDPLGDRYEVDHVVPFSKDGPTETWNMQAVHSDCHRKKNCG